MTGAEAGAPWCATGMAHVRTGPRLGGPALMAGESPRVAEAEATGAVAGAAADAAVQQEVAAAHTAASPATVDTPAAEARPGARSAEAYFVPELPGFFFSIFFIRA